MARLRPRLALVYLSAIAAIDVSSSVVSAQSFSVLAHFEMAPDEASGAPLVLAPGLIYGTSLRGGAFDRGSVFALYLAADGSWRTLTLHSFTGRSDSDGASAPLGLAAGRDGYLYGVTRGDGQAGIGTVFRMGLFGGLTTLHSFPSVPPYQSPSSTPIQVRDGRFFGTLCSNNDDNPGEIFTMTPGGTVSIFFRFTESMCPTNIVEGPDGHLYGMARCHGATCVFRLTLNGQLTILTRRAEAPAGALRLGSDGHLYGVTDTDATVNTGAVFAITRAGEEVASAAISVGRPRAIVEASPGVFQIVTGSRLSFRGGRVLRFDAAGNLSVQFEWEGDRIGVGEAGLTRGSNGLVYGLSQLGGSAEMGAAFTIDASGAASPLLSFHTRGPSVPFGPLLEDGGALHGTSCRGGIGGGGTVFKLAGGTLTTLHEFMGGDGRCPTSLVKGPDGNFFGTTTIGTIFRISPAGAFTLLHTHAPTTNSRQEADTLTVGADGKLWGNWWDNTRPFIFSITTDGELTRYPLSDTLRRPGPGLLQASDGLFYGRVGSFNYRVAPGEQPAPFLHSSVSGVLMQASDGFLYGTAGGAVMLRIALDLQTSIIHQFTPQEGNPVNSVVELRSGELAGVTFGALNFGDLAFGTAYAMTKSGVFRQLHRFGWFDGANPVASPIVGSDGGLYGTTMRGGIGGGGVIYRIIP